MNIKKSWIILGIIALIAIWSLSARNSFVLMEETIDASWAQVENQMQRRYDLIPNLVNTVKGISKQEQEVFLGIAKSREKLAGASTPQQKIAASNQLEGYLSRLLVVVEKYPELKSSQSYNNLMFELSGTENRLSTERRRYNQQIEAYNKSLRIFPKSLIGSLFGFEKKAYFEVDELAKTNVEVKF